MTVPTNLFIDSPESKDPSMTQVSSDTTEWPEQVITKLKERVPECSVYSMSLKFMAKDDELGTATGSITVTDGKSAAVVPVIIRDFSMFPLDVFFFQGKVLPLIPQYFLEAFKQDGDSAFSTLTEFPQLSVFDRYMRGENIQNAIFPPNWGRYSYASAKDATERYPILDSVASQIDGAAFRKSAERDPQSVIRFSKNHPGLMAKIASYVPVNLGEFRTSVDKLVMRTVHVVKRDGPNRYTLLSTPDKVFHPVIQQMGREDCKSFMSAVSEKSIDPMTEVDQEGEKLIVTTPPDLTSTTSTGEPAHVTRADHFGLYTTKDTKTGVYVTGLVVPRVIDFNQEVQDMSIFIGKTNSTIQGEIWGVEVTGQDRWMPESCLPQVGQTGTFMLRDKMKAAVATIPVTIKSIAMDYNKNLTIKAVDLYGNSLKITTQCESNFPLKRIVAHPSDGLAGSAASYLIPRDMEWFPMDGFSEVSSSPYSYAEKIGSASLHKIQVVSTGYGNYEMRGLDKFAATMGVDRTFLNSAQTKFLMAAAGVPVEQIKTAMDHLKVHKLVDVNVPTERVPVTLAEKVASNTDKARESVLTANSIKVDLLKEASYMESAQTVDAMLSLNFVTPENLSKFVEKIGLFKATISHLASCLVASRLGVREIPEQETDAAMMKLVDVVNGLESIRAVASQKGTKKK